MPIIPQPKKRKKRSFRAWFKALPWWIRIPSALGVIVGVIGLLTGVTLFIIYGQIAKKFDLTNLGEMPQRSVVYDVRGKVLGRLHGQNRIVVPFEQISPHFVKALLAREDARFRDHGGVDYVGALRAAVRNVKDRRFVQGASTITMQLARNSFGMTERTLHRKLVEVMLARRIESEFTKDEILELYINRIFFGGGIYGLELASQTYFGKPASSLTLAESAMVAGLIRSPNRFSPIRNFEGACKERDDVLARMIETGTITPKEAETAEAELIRVMPPSEPTAQDDYALDVVRRDLDLVLAEENVEDGGLAIYTTVDADLQRASEQALRIRLASVESSPKLQGATVVIDNRTGGITSIVGGREPNTGTMNRAIEGDRPAGSAFLPFVYATAYEGGMLPGTYVDDAPIQPDELPNESDFDPQNTDGKYLGLRPLEDGGLTRSRATMTVRVGSAAGLAAVSETAGTAGIRTPENPTPQILTGGISASVKNLTSAYSIFPNNGQRRRPYIIDRIEDSSGNLIYRSGVISYSVISPASATLVDRALRKTMEPGGVAANVRELGFDFPAGGKTGSTDDLFDAWFIGYTDRLTCGVWIGFDQPPEMVDRGFGRATALPIWVDIMKSGRRFGYRTVEIPARPASREVNLCRINGRLSTYGCKRHGHADRDALPESVIPTNRCRLHDGPTRFPLKGSSGIR